MLSGVTFEEMEDTEPTMIDIQNLKHKESCGVVEEPENDNNEEQRIKKLHLNVTRGVSIVSLSEDEASSRASLSPGIPPNEHAEIHKIEVVAGSVVETTLTADGLNQPTTLDIESMTVCNDNTDRQLEHKELLKPNKGKLLEKDSSEVKTLQSKRQELSLEAVKSPGINEATVLDFDKINTVKSPAANQIDNSECQKSKLAQNAQTFPVEELSEKPTTPVYTNSSDTKPQAAESEDPEVEALLRRIQKQRSVLGEILDKEGERNFEGESVVVYSCKYVSVERAI